jgi:hypothetical protein
VPGEGIEPPTFGLQNRCSTAELTRQIKKLVVYWVPIGNQIPPVRISVRSLARILLHKVNYNNRVLPLSLANSERQPWGGMIIAHVGSFATSNTP